jgi:biotin transport system substrate-specific component
VSKSSLPIAALLWPSGSNALSNLVRAAVLVAIGVLLLTLSAKFNLPLPYVPMTLQTLVVLLLGGIYGWRLGTATVVAYLAVGALGLPVFAGPLGGLKPLLGPTAGFLGGFVVAACVTGWLSERGWDRSVGWLFVAMALGHLVILVMGFAWLAYGIGLGATKAWSAGVAPFVAGAVVKNTLGAILVSFLRGMVDRRVRLTSAGKF